jgi:hypothetical protein
MKRATFLLAVTALAACSGQRTQEGPDSTPRPESISEATGEIQEVTMPEPELTDAERTALRVDRIEVAVKPAAIHEGDTARLEVRVRDAASAPVTGVMAQVFVRGRVAEISDDGRMLFGRDPGEGSVIVRVEAPAANGEPARTITGEAPIQVLAAVVTRLDVGAPASDLYAGARYPLSVEAYSDIGPRSDAAVLWRSSDESVARVSGHGSVLAVAPGAARIEASADGVTSGIDVRVVDNPIRSLAVQPAEADVRAGDVLHFSADALDANGLEVTDAPIEWSVSSIDGYGNVAAVIDPDGTFVANGPGAFRVTASVGGISNIIEVSADPRAPRRTVTLKAHGVVPPEAGTTTDLWVFEGVDGRDYAYTGTMQAATMYAWDVTDPSNPVITDSVKVDGRRANDVKINADATIAVMTSERASNRRNGITIVDISDPAHPRKITHFTEGLTGGVHNVWIEGDLVYAVHNGTNAVHIVDISDPAAPRNVGRWQVENPGRSLHDVIVEDGLAYLSYWDDGLVVLDVGAGIKGGTPTEPVEVSRYTYRTRWGAESYGNTHHAIRYKNYVFLADEIFGCTECVNGPRGHVHVIDVTDIESPHEVATYRVPEAGAHNMWVEADKLYVAYYQAGLRVVDISGELRGDLYAQGREIGWYMTEDSEGVVPNSTDSWGPQPYKGNIFVSDGSSGLWIVELDEERQELVP